MSEKKPSVLQYIRAFFYYLGFYPLTIIHSSLSLIVSPVLNFQQRFKFITLINYFYIFWLRICCGVDVKITGREHLPKDGAYVAVANHSSEWETLFLQTFVRPQCAVLKKELLSIPFFGWALGLLKPIAIDRKQRRGALKQLLTEGKSRLEEGIPVVIFPQGTRVPVGKMGKFNKGGAMLALSAGVPVVPIIHNAGIYWPGKSFTKTPGVVQVHVGESIPVEGRTVDEVHADVVEWLEKHMKELGLV
ncbi:1-acyl-sn-glycerol-3-phosphate acyltransferase [Neptuniibacter sp. 2_MG-2023]|uniref:lysophospholipid acyltransferase family protein n=1 Tax=Neptuniibacter sp. 2_MG-2023 TaxID=3062671 RepID=UPI0026E30810|nr:lysophospholipid acyltransferase family protein [Neptuniibacter sp. 2_MG-2023]MDO6513903.1 lysophospholipid acyltransferase family protein [Neptuniibacter sp. 2_MG-2023]